MSKASSCLRSLMSAFIALRAQPKIEHAILDPPRDSDERWTQTSQRTSSFTVLTDESLLKFWIKSYLFSFLFVFSVRSKVENGKHKALLLGTCRSDARYPDKLHKSLKEFEAAGKKAFIPFPKPSQGVHKCQRWINACSREGFTKEIVNRNTYICALHWLGEKGPTPDHPDPLKANFTPKQIAKALFRFPHFQIHITLRIFLGERSFASPISNTRKVHQTDSNPGPHDQWANALTTRLPARSC